MMKNVKIALVSVMPANAQATMDVQNATVMKWKTSNGICQR